MCFHLNKASFEVAKWPEQRNGKDEMPVNATLLVRTGPDSELARMNTLVSLSPNVKRTVLST